jgi:hypothetical protein
MMNLILHKAGLPIDLAVSLVEKTTGITVNRHPDDHLCQAIYIGKKSAFLINNPSKYGSDYQHLTVSEYKKRYHKAS